MERRCSPSRVAGDRQGLPPASQADVKPAREPRVWASVFSPWRLAKPDGNYTRHVLAIARTMSAWQYSATSARVGSRSAAANSMRFDRRGVARSELHDATRASLVSAFPGELARGRELRHDRANSDSIWRHGVSWAAHCPPIWTRQVLVCGSSRHPEPVRSLFPEHRLFAPGLATGLVVA